MPICRDDFPHFEPFKAHILSHDKGWVEAEARQVNMRGNVVLTSSKGINGGTPGGPIVTDDGRLIGVCSSAGGAVGSPRAM